MKRKILIIMVLGFAAVSWLACGEETKSVTRKEYDQLKADVDALRHDVGQIKETGSVSESADDLEAEIAGLARKVKSATPGSTKFLLTGYGFGEFTAPDVGNSAFSAGFNPIFLWELSPRILFEGELEVEPTVDESGASESELSLEYADVSYILNDYLTLGAGKFLLPLGIFNQHLHPAWVNKLPDRPLPYDDEVGIAPESDIGAYLRGAADVRLGVLTYTLFVGNGPALITQDPEAAGTMDFDNFADNNDNKAVGGRVGFRPVPGFEVGYSIEYSKVNPLGFKSVDALIQVVDASYMQTIAPLLGVLDVHAEWVWSHVGQATYDPTGLLGFGPLSFNNDRNAGYVQIAYRPTQAPIKVVRQLELVSRCDVLNTPELAPGSFDETRWAMGLDYWVSPSFVLKGAYEIDNKNRAGEDNNMILLQAALGF